MTTTRNPIDKLLLSEQSDRFFHADLMDRVSFNNIDIIPYLEHPRIKSVAHLKFGYRTLFDKALRFGNKKVVEKMLELGYALPDKNNQYLKNLVPTNPTRPALEELLVRYDFYDKKLLLSDLANLSKEIYISNSFCLKLLDAGAVIPLSKTLFTGNTQLFNYLLERNPEAMLEAEFTRRTHKIIASWHKQHSYIPMVFLALEVLERVGAHEKVKRLHTQFLKTFQYVYEHAYSPYPQKQFEDMRAAVIHRYYENYPDNKQELLKTILTITDSRLEELKNKLTLELSIKKIDNVGHNQPQSKKFKI